jgi:hypothetical protein
VPTNPAVRLQVVRALLRANEADGWVGLEDDDAE